MEQNKRDVKSLLKSRRCVVSHSTDYDAISYLDEFEDHCLTLKNALHVILTCVTYETLVKEEDQARSTPDTPHYTSDIQRINNKLSPDAIQDF